MMDLPWGSPSYSGLRPRYKLVMFVLLLPSAMFLPAAGHWGWDLTGFGVIVGRKVVWLGVKTNLALKSL